MNAKDLKNSILQLAIQGKLVEQREEDGTAKELLEKIKAEKKLLAKEGKIKKQKILPAIKEDEIPFDIPESWEWVRLGEIGEIVGGGTPKTGNSEFWNGGEIPWLTPADMKFVIGKYVKNGERFITEQGLKGSSARLMPKGTIIYSSRAPIGYVAIAQNNLATNQGFKSLVPFEIGINEFMYYCLISRTNEIISRASGTTFKEISGSEFGLTIVPLPPIEEQKRIVAKIEELIPYVDKYDEAYTEVEKLNKKFPEDMQKSIVQYGIQGKLVEQREEDGTAEDLYKQILEEEQKLIAEGKIKKTKMLPEITEDEIPFDIPENWKWVYINEVAFVTKLAGFEYTKNIAPNLTAEGIPLFKGKNVQNGKIVLEFESFIPEKVSDELKRSQITRKCLLTPYVGTIGNIAIFNGEFKAHLGPNVGKIELYNESDTYIIEEYILYYLWSNTGYKELTKYKKATAQASISIEAIRNVIFPLPPLAEQRRIVERIEKLIPYAKQLAK